jgi:hypothetical protein
MGTAQVAIAQHYLCERMPAMARAHYTAHPLDGPPDGPRYAVTAELCRPEGCPYGVPGEQAARGCCPIRNCPGRCSVRLLIDRQGNVVQMTTSGLHWSPDGSF